MSEDTPRFFIIGAPKCGTTSLWHELRKHPDIYMPDKKEPHFFDKHFHRGQAWYQSFFEGANGEKILGEATPGYSDVWRFPETPKRMAQTVPEARLIYIVRHPLRRMESAWKQNVDLGRLPTDTFSDAVQKYRPIVEGTRYFHNLDAFRKYIPDERILVLFLEDFADHERSVLKRCDEFLGVSPSARPKAHSKAKNVASRKRVVGKRLKAMRETPGWGLVKRVLPFSLRSLIKGTFFMKPLPEPVWESSTRRWAVNEVSNDAKRILQFAEKPDNFWEL